MGAVDWKHGLLLSAVVACVYGNSMQGSFHYDDFHSIVDNPHIRDLGNTAAFFADLTLFSADPQKAMYRPLLLLTYTANFYLGGYGVFGYHVVNTLLHLACTLLVWSLATTFGCRRRGAVGAALLFAVHPICGEPVNYISSRSELLAGVGVIGALWAYLRWRLAPASSARWPYLVAAVLAYAVGLLSKSVAIALPAFLVLYELRSGWPPRRWLPYQGIFWLVSAVYLGIVHGMVAKAMVASPVRGFGVQLLTQAKALVYYGLQLVMPVKLSVEHQFFESAPGAAPALVSLALLASGLWLGRRHYRHAGALWPALAVLALAPTLLVPLNVLVNEHRLYLPLAGLVLWPGRFWERLVNHRRLAPILVLTLALLSIASFQRNELWKSELSLWRDAAEKAPEMPRVHVHLGNALRRDDRPAEATRSFQAALALDPGHRAAATNLGAIYFEAAVAMDDSAFAAWHYDMAAGYYEQALAVDADYPEALNNLGSVYMMLERYRDAVDVLERVATRSPNFADVFYNLGMARYYLGDLQGAISAYERALVLAPDHETNAELGRVYADSGRWEEAAEAYRRALQQLERPDYRSNLGEVLLQLGRARAHAGDREGGVRAWREARTHFRHLAARAPHGKAARRLEQLRRYLAP